MALVYADRIKETSTSTGTGAFTLSGAATGYRALSAAPGIAVGDSIPYAIEAVDSSGTPTGGWEVGLGTYSAASELTRTTVYASSNAGAAVSFAAGTKYVFLTIPATHAAWPRERLTAARTYYVRSDGSDSNTGLVNSAGGAFLTIQKAVDVAAMLDLSVYDVTLQIGDATYAENVLLKSTVGAGRVIIKGNAGTPANVHLSVGSGNGIYAESVVGRYRVQDLKLSYAAGIAIYANGAPSYIEVQNVEFGVCTTHMTSQTDGYINVIGSYAIVGAAGQHIQALFATVRLTSGITVTITGTPAFSTGFANVNRGGLITIFSITFSGSATGVRYNASTNGVCFVNGAGATYLPGNSAGTTATGGQYA